MLKYLSTRAARAGFPRRVVDRHADQIRAVFKVTSVQIEAHRACNAQGRYNPVLAN